MKRLAAVALVLVGMAGGACAQHGGAHGGFSGGHGGFSGGGASGHVSSGVHGGFSAPASRGFAGAGARAGGRVYFPARGLQRPGMSGYNRGPYTGGAYAGGRNAGGSWRYRRPYVSRYRPVYGYGVGGWAVPYYLGDPGFGYDSDDSGDQQTAQNAAPEGYDQSPYDEQGPPPYPAYPPPYPQAPAGVQSPAANEDAVTLIFKDGRPPEQIRNFLFTQGTLYVGGDRRREISVDDIDLAATASVNRELGVAFQIPAGSR